MNHERLPQPRIGRAYLLLLLLGAVIGLMFLLSKCSHTLSVPRQLHPKVVKSGGDTIDVAIEISPLSYYVSGDTMAGLDYEIMRSLAALGHRPVKFHVISDFEKAAALLDEGLYDVVISALPATGELKKRFRTTEHLYLDRQVLVQLKDSPTHIDTPDALAGDTVWIAAGSPFEGRIANLSAELGDSIHVATIDGCTAEHLVMLVANGDIPRAVVNAGLAARMKSALYPALDTDTPIGFTQFQSWIVTGGNPEFADSLDTWIRRYRETPDYEQTLRKYIME